MFKLQTVRKKEERNDSRDFFPKEEAIHFPRSSTPHHCLRVLVSELVTWQLIGNAVSYMKLGFYYLQKRKLVACGATSLLGIRDCILASGFTIYHFIPYLTHVPLTYKIFTYWFPQNALLLSNLLWKSWLTALFTEDIACLTLLLFRPSALSASVFSEPTVFSLEGRAKGMILFCSFTLIIVMFLSEPELEIAPWLCSILILPVAKGWVGGGSHVSCSSRLAHWLSSPLPCCFWFLSGLPLPSRLVPCWSPAGMSRHSPFSSCCWRPEGSLRKISPWCCTPISQKTPCVYKTLLKDLGNNIEFQCWW